MTASRSSFGGILFALTALSGCSVDAALSQRGAMPSNECSQSSECPSGQCIDGVCVAPSSEFGTVLVEVTPPDDSTASGVRFFQTLENLPLGGGERNIELAPVARVTGRVSADTDGCPPLRFADDAGDPVYMAAADGSLPVRVVLTPSQRLIGRPTATYAAEALPPVSSENGALQAPELPFTVDVPPGEYDIYVQTLPQVEVGPGQSGCVVAPRLYRRQAIAGEVMLNLDLSAPSWLDLNVDLPVTVGSLADWTADIVDPVSGRLISTRVKLGMPTAQGDVIRHSVKLAYSPVLGTEPSNSEAGLELVRLSPPEGVVAPVLITERWVLDIDGDGTGTIDQITALPTPVTVEGKLSAALGPEASRGTVTLVATEITGLSRSVTASFVRAVEALPAMPGDPPKFEVSLLPGKYLVSAVPPSESGLSATQTTWEVAASPAVQYGKVVQLSPTAVLSGGALDPSGANPVVGGSVHALATFAGSAVTVRDQAVWGISPYVPRASTGVVDDQGLFEIKADPGRFDVSVRPPESSGFPWLVKPDVEVEPTGTSLGSVILPLPILHQGTVRITSGGSDEGANVPNALLRAFVFLDENHAYTANPNAAKSVIQIAETRADAMGRFKLLLPPQLH